jgi:hypothetical protein
MFRFLRPVSLALLFFAASSVAQAQWLVYELRFQEEAGSVNFSFYTGAYGVAPVHGGAASIVFTTEAGGSYYAVSQNSLRYYIAANQGVKQAVLSAFSINGTAQAFYSASGSIDSTVNYTEEGVSRSSSVAGTLAGMLLASDDESFQAPASDGSLGMIGRASITGSLRTDLTQIANQSAITMSDAVGSIVGLLEKYNYRPDVGDVPSPTTENVTSDAIEPNNSDISALFGGQEQPAALDPVEPSTAEVIQPSLFPPVSTDEN